MGQTKQASRRGNFRDLKDKIDRDPQRRARVDLEKQEAVAEHVAEGLAQLRAMREITQGAIADHLAMAQSNVSRIEHQGDLLLSTLRTYVEGLGGRLELAVVFGDDEERVQLEV